jgi:hypothetical protein
VHVDSVQKASQHFDKRKMAYRAGDRIGQQVLASVDRVTTEGVQLAVRFCEHHEGPFEHAARAASMTQGRQGSFLMALLS